MNITLPEQTVRILNRVASRGNRSRLIDAAVRRYIHQLGGARLRRQLAEGYRQSAREDLDIASEWFHLDEEAWQ
jgi:metal-responsive CopG/Arc/MetJ family transcriptional regulator